MIVMETPLVVAAALVVVAVEEVVVLRQATLIAELVALKVDVVALAAPVAVAEEGMQMIAAAENGVAATGVVLADRARLPLLSVINGATNILKLMGSVAKGVAKSVLSAKSA